MKAFVGVVFFCIDSIDRSLIQTKTKRAGVEE